MVLGGCFLNDLLSLHPLNDEIWAINVIKFLLALAEIADLKKPRGHFHLWAMRQRKLGSHTPPCHRRMVITTLFNVMLAGLQRRPVLYHTRWLLTVHWLCSSKH